MLMIRNPGRIARIQIRKDLKIQIKRNLTSQGLNSPGLLDSMLVDFMHLYWDTKAQRFVGDSFNSTDNALYPTSPSGMRRYPKLEYGVNIKDEAPGYSEILSRKNSRDSFDKGVIVIILIDNYTGDGPHTNHALAAFKYKKRLWCFNPWGSAIKQNKVPNHQRSNAKGDRMEEANNSLWFKVRNLYQCTDSIAFDGFNFQSGDTKGACVPYALAFASHIYTEYILFRLRGNSFQPFYLNTMSDQLSVTPSKRWVQLKYNNWVQSLFDTLNAPYGGRLACSQGGQLRMNQDRALQAANGTGVFNNMVE